MCQYTIYTDLRSLGSYIDTLYRSIVACGLSYIYIYIHIYIYIYIIHLSGALEEVPRWCAGDVLDYSRNLSTAAELNTAGDGSSLWF